MSKPYDPFYYLNQQLSEAIKALEQPNNILLEELAKSRQRSQALEQLTQENFDPVNLGISSTELNLGMSESDVANLRNQLTGNNENITKSFSLATSEAQNLMSAFTEHNISEAEYLLQAFKKQNDENIQRLENFLSPTFKNIEQFSNDYQDLLDQILNPLNLNFLDKLNNKVKVEFGSVIQWLLSHGWTLDWRKSFFKIFESQSDDEQKLNDIFNFFKAKAKSITKKAHKLSPHRKRIIKTAYKAHKRGEYELSVPVFLSQTEGIAIDHLGIDGLFHNNPKNKKKIETLFEKCENSKRSTQLVSKIESPIFQSKKDRDGSFKGLNRHLVLHGESTDYATEENSLKCLALMSYICQMIEKVKKFDL